MTRQTKKHPLYRWLEALRTVRFENYRAWVSSEDENEEKLAICLSSLDEIRATRALIRPSTNELGFAAQILESADEHGWDANDDPPLDQLRGAWLEPQASSLRGIRFKLLHKRTVVRLKFSTGYSPGFDQNWGYVWYSFDKDRAVVFWWSDVMYEPGTPEWAMLRPLGLVQIENIIPSTCLLLLSRAKANGPTDCFELDEPNWSESQTQGRRISAVDVFRILLAMSGASPDVAIGLGKKEIKSYRTRTMNWGYEELEAVFPS